MKGAVGWTTKVEERLPLDSPLRKELGEREMKPEHV